ncbi:hypothetical protein K7432_001519 [Basidiobolus ranarum]|uniref:GDP/GTP exchange factor Sec2 N-terminal domain-containing protein n=1 Tax=Basidiobolus ranarum TaxID=34480 RepID=A0ABR2X378_9FUNG
MPANNVSEVDLLMHDSSKLQSRLQTVITNARRRPISMPTPPRPTTLSQALSRQEQSSSRASSVSPSTSSLSSPCLSVDDIDTSTIKEDSTHYEGCPCAEIFSGNNPTTCKQCGRVFGQLRELQIERLRLLDDLDTWKSRYDEVQESKKLAEQENDRLRVQIQDLQNNLMIKSEKCTSLEQDVTALNYKYVNEIEKVAELNIAKQLVEGEYAELSRSLFEEANGMVASEARQRYELELACKSLQKQLEDTNESLSNETQQLKELKLKLQEFLVKPESAHLTNGSGRSRNLSIRSDSSVESGLSGEFNEANNELTIHMKLLDEFETFLAKVSNPRLTRIYAIPFMKYCLEEDVEPCLRLGSIARYSPRKLADAVFANTLTIEEAPPTTVQTEPSSTQPSPKLPPPKQSLIWDRISGVNLGNTKGCQACGREGYCHFRFRISNNDEWVVIDSYCRDRLVAACEFYVFIRNIRLGLFNHRNIDVLWTESLRLRIQMFFARVGMLKHMTEVPLIDTDKLHIYSRKATTAVDRTNPAPGPLDNSYLSEDTPDQTTTGLRARSFSLSKMERLRPLFKRFSGGFDEPSTDKVEVKDEPSGQELTPLGEPESVAV